MFLERNLEQLTVVQRQLVEQNSSLKKEVAIAERKLIARNERIQSLESLLQDSQEKLTAANHRYVYLTLPRSARTDITQLRVTTYSRQRAPRGREGRLHARSWVTECRCILCVRRRCWLAHRQTSSWRRRRRPSSAYHRQPPEGRRSRA
jgi:ATP phosphoribosyltransferase